MTEATTTLTCADLERSFAVVIEPVPGGATADKRGAAIAPAPEPRRAWNLKWIGPALVLGIAATFFADFLSIGTREHGTSTPAAPRPTAPMSPMTPMAPPPELPPQTPWTTDTSTWSMPMPTYAPYLGIAANGIRSTRTNGRERFSFDDIVIEKNPARAEVEYFELRFSVTYYDEKSGDTGSAGGFDTRIEDIRGKLTAESPVLVLKSRTIVAPVPKGIITRMRYHLAVNAVSSRPKYVHEKSREIASR